MKKVVILGGGIAGVEAAIYCRKAGFAVELVSERDYLFVYPIAIWIPVSTLPFEKALLPLSRLAQKHGFTLTIDQVRAISSAQKQFTLEKAGVRHEEIVIIALGAGKMKPQGVEHTLSICGDPEQSLLLKEKIDSLIAQGYGKINFGFGGNPKDMSAVRGGPGFELFFNLHHRLKRLGIREKYEMTFFAPMAEPGGRMGAKALSMLRTMFESNRFHTRYGKKIKQFESEKIIFEDDTVLESDLTMFIPAGSGHPFILESDLPKNGAGFIRIDSTCQIEGVEAWYAIGDAAALEGPEWKAKQGHIAEVMARHAAHNLAVTYLGREGNKQTYHEHLSIICLMDMGEGAGFIYRDHTKAFFIPIPFIGHGMKQLWGHYYKLSKKGIIPRIPGL
ncbi:MAG: FAD-dependent oxidoreductase [Sulfuricurvum sp.]|jgi:sulfide:quinone oxidoreductase|uniref:NAD(P)/FAD-dependent oxidoreductase n=1 Tax=Sulfuricurvum sp. TaxID=2025608 RepID=UPI0025F30CE9|nr:FAD-dependent oxidoreductase [Sulfuricurvum sp.]MCK9371597.1 FAD-dependent oxidoreductase [Sulfuricurvum sp.]